MAMAIKGLGRETVNVFALGGWHYENDEFAERLYLPILRQISIITSNV
jgi:hypothetical protein